MKISVYAIAKNEAKFARRWYECVKEADEVCVLDTGSTDDTVAILSSLGAKVESKIFTPFDFAAARNASMALCSPDADYLFCMDLDEVVSKGWRKLLEDRISEAIKGGLDVTAVQYKEALNFNPDGSYHEVFRQLKIVRPGTAVWKRPIHECLEFMEWRPLEIPELVVEHRPDETKDRDYYIDMLKQTVKESDPDIRSFFYLGKEYFRRGRYTEAIENYKTYVHRGDGIYLPVERCLAMLDISRGYAVLGDEHLSEFWLWRASGEDDTNRSPLFWLGVNAYNRKEYKAAASIMQRCLKIPDDVSLYSREDLAYGEQPYKILSDALWLIGKKEDAFCVASNMLQKFPENPVAQNQYNGIGKALGKI